MQRRHFLASLGALLGFPQVAPSLSSPTLPAALPTVRDCYSAADLFLAGYAVEAVVLSLCNVDFRMDGLPINTSSLGCRIPIGALPQEEVFATVAASNVTIIERRSGVWLDCDDATFNAVTGNEAGLVVGLRFEQGMGEPIVGFLTDSLHFLGLPVTPNGGNIRVEMPIEGLLQIR